MHFIPTKPDPKIILKTESLTGFLSKKLNELMGSSYYFDLETNTFLDNEIQTQLAKAEKLWATAEETSISNEKEEQLHKQSILNQAEEIKKLEQQRILEQRAIAEKNQELFLQESAKRQEIFEEAEGRIHQELKKQDEKLKEIRSAAHVAMY